MVGLVAADLRSDGLRRTVLRDKIVTQVKADWECETWRAWAIRAALSNDTGNTSLHPGQGCSTS